MKLSRLIVSKDRKHFIPWCSWNVRKQSRQPDEVIVVDTSKESEENLWREHLGDDIRVIRGPYEWNTGDSRNCALDAATGDVIMFFDTDDWIHPRSSEVLGAAIEQGYDIAYVANTHRLILDTMELINVGETEGQVSLPFSAVRADIAHKHSFPSTFTAEDVNWLIKVKQDCPKVYFHRTWEVASMALIHGTNTWNKPDLPEYNFYKSVIDTTFPKRPPKGVSAEEWEETTLQLAALKERLG